MKRAIGSTIAAGIWITLSEFLRNEFLFKSYWLEHFTSMGLPFETLPINGILWMVWSFILAYVIFSLLQKLSFIKAMFLSWIAAFLMMWIALYNLQVLPLNLLLFAIPLSIIEVAVAGLIIEKM